jgi:hypothetical protein
VLAVERRSCAGRCLEVCQSRDVVVLSKTWDLTEPVLVDSPEKISGHPRVQDAGATREDVDREMWAVQVRSLQCGVPIQCVVWCNPVTRQQIIVN